MPNFKVYVTVYHRIDVEASNKEEAKELAKEEIWDDHIKDVIMDVEEVDDVEPMETLSDLTAYWNKHGNGNGEWEKQNDKG